MSCANSIKKGGESSSKEISHLIFPARGLHLDAYLSWTLSNVKFSPRCSPLRIVLKSRVSCTCWVGGGESKQIVGFKMVTISCIVRGNVIIWSPCLPRNLTLHLFPLIDFTLECKYTLSLPSNAVNTVPGHSGPGRDFPNMHQKSLSVLKSQQLLAEWHGDHLKLLVGTSGMVLICLSVTASKGCVLLLAGCFLISNWKLSLKMACLRARALNTESVSFSSHSTI